MVMMVTARLLLLSQTELDLVLRQDQQLRWCRRSMRFLLVASVVLLLLLVMLLLLLCSSLL